MLGKTLTMVWLVVTTSIMMSFLDGHHLDHVDPPPVGVVVHDYRRHDHPHGVTIQTTG